MCKGIYVEVAKKSFSDLTNSATYKSKKTLDKWLRYAKCMLNGYSIRKSAEIVEINIATSFYWRHKILNCISEFLGIGFVDGLVDGFMWGAIFAGGAQILSGGFKQLAKLGVNVRKNSFFKIFTPNRLRGETEIARIAGHGQKYYEYGGTLLKIGKNMLDVSNKTFLHLHLWFTGSAHIPFGTILAGIIGGF